MVAWLDAVASERSHAVSPRPLVGPRLQRVLALVPWIARAPRRHDRRARRALRGVRARARARPRAAADVRAAAVHRRPAHRRVGRSTAVSRSGSPSTSSDRCASRRPKVSRCSPPDARCSRCPAPTPTVRSRPRSASSTTRSARRGQLAVDVGASDQLERLQDAAATDEQVEIDYYSFARDEMTTRIVDPVARLPRVRRLVPRGVVPPGRRRAPVPRRPCPRRARRTGEHFDPPPRAATTTSARPRVPPAARRPARDAAPRAGGRAGWSRATRTSRPTRAQGRLVATWCSRSASRRGSNGSSSALGPDATVGGAPRSSSSLGAGRRGAAPRAGTRDLRRCPGPRVRFRARDLRGWGRGAASVTDDVDAPDRRRAARRSEALAPPPHGQRLRRHGARARPTRPARGDAKKQHASRTVIEWGDPHRRRDRHRDRHQDVPVPGVLHPVGVDGARRSRSATACSSTS